MNGVQLEFNISDETDVEIKINYMQKEIDDMRKSCDKVRKKLFSQMTEFTKLCMQLQEENESIKSTLRKLTNEPEWTYGKENSLFNVRKHPETKCKCR